MMTTLIIFASLSLIFVLTFLIVWIASKDSSFALKWTWGFLCKLVPGLLIIGLVIFLIGKATEYITSIYGDKIGFLAFILISIVILIVIHFIKKRNYRE